jgi:hypothetical protein
VKPLPKTLSELLDENIFSSMGLDLRRAIPNRASIGVSLKSGYF